MKLRRRLQGPPLLKGIFGSLRGYAGNISPAAALDAVSNDGNALLIDIRCAPACRPSGSPSGRPSEASTVRRLRKIEESSGLPHPNPQRSCHQSHCALAWQAGAREGVRRPDLPQTSAHKDSMHIGMAGRSARRSLTVCLILTPKVSSSKPLHDGVAGRSAPRSPAACLTLTPKGFCHQCHCTMAWQDGAREGVWRPAGPAERGAPGGAGVRGHRGPQGPLAAAQRVRHRAAGAQRGTSFLSRLVPCLGLVLFVNRSAHVIEEHKFPDMLHRCLPSSKLHARCTLLHPE